MNPLLNKKLTELEQAKDYECWYLVKQPTEFDKLCYLVSFLKQFQADGSPGNLQAYISEKIAVLQAQKPGLSISDNYRALRVAAFFGLICMNGTSYGNADITAVFLEIENRCGGEFEHTGQYADIIERQIEKIYLSSPVDEEYQGVREHYRLYPVMLLYKVLLELGRATGCYYITMTEYRYLVATTRTCKGFLDTLLQINLLRAEQYAAAQFEQYRSKFDNRFIQALKQLPALEISGDLITLRSQSIRDTARKVHLFEEDPERFTGSYLDFLCSTRSLFDTEEAGETAAAAPNQRAGGGSNILLYGVPGAGKSWAIAHDYCANEDFMERLVFHPDYTYSDFVGQILPRAENGLVSYRFTEGPFTKILQKAHNDPAHHYFLVIEELNRGNAPAIFGEVFQLLDRDDSGTSEYGITNEDIAGAVYGDPAHKVRLPSNLTILGTMNTSDQNVFTLDTAFQRRWCMRMIENSFDNHPYADKRILDTGVTWRRFCETINREISSGNTGMGSAGDKRLGAYFVHEADLNYRPDDPARSPAERTAARLANQVFAEKVLKYLWDDVFQFSREDLFNTGRYQSLEAVVGHFNGRDASHASGNARFDVFRQELADELCAAGSPWEEDTP